MCVCTCSVHPVVNSVSFCCHRHSPLILNHKRYSRRDTVDCYKTWTGFVVAKIFPETYPSTDPAAERRSILGRQENQCLRFHRLTRRSKVNRLLLLKNSGFIKKCSLEICLCNKSNKLPSHSHLLPLPLFDTKGKQIPPDVREYKVSAIMGRSRKGRFYIDKKYGSIFIIY